MEKTAIMVPIRGLNTAMTRLRKNLPGKEVDKLVKSLFNKTVTLVSNLNFPLIIITPDTLINEYDYEGNVTVYRDPGTSLNKAIYLVTDHFEYENYLLVMPDLPGLNQRHLNIVLRAKQLFSNVIIPTVDKGTAIAFLHKDLFQLKYFGKNSSTRIINFAQKNHISVSKLLIKELERDLDTIEDWNYWHKDSQIN